MSPISFGQVIGSPASTAAGGTGSVPGRHWMSVRRPHKRSLLGNVVSVLHPALSILHSEGQTTLRDPGEQCCAVPEMTTLDFCGHAGQSHPQEISNWRPLPVKPSARFLSLSHPQEKYVTKKHKQGSSSVVLCLTWRSHCSGPGFPPQLGI